MGGVPVTIVDSGGVSVIDIDGAEPVTRADGAAPVTLVETGGVPVTFVTAALARDPQNNLDAQMAELPLSLWWDPATSSTGFIARDATGPNAGDGDPVGYRLDRSGNGLHAQSPADDQRPILSVAGAVAQDTWDGVNDDLGVAFSAGTLPADCSVFFGIDTSDSQLVSIIGHTGEHYMGVADSSNSYPVNKAIGVSASTFVDGVQLSPETRTEFQSAVVGQGKRIVEIRRADLGAWTEFRPGWHPAIPGFRMAGSVSPVVIIPTSALTDDTRNSIIIPWFLGRGFRTFSLSDLFGNGATAGGAFVIPPGETTEFDALFFGGYTGAGFIVAPSEATEFGSLFFGGYTGAAFTVPPKPNAGFDYLFSGGYTGTAFLVPNG